MPSVRVGAVSLLLVFLTFAPDIPAQLRIQPVAGHPDEVTLQLMLRKLSSIGTFMQTTAHPDDEDNTVLAMLGYGEGMRTVLVTATRGDGGQNEIGPELFQALAILRTEELLAAHRFDGAEQYFTRAIDFGYSFSVEESLQKWGHDEILGDFVRHIRALRPDVIAGFLCGGAGGGQHHQASALLTREAFRVAADPAKYPEQIREGLRPWQAKRIFCTDVSSFRQTERNGTASADLLPPVPDRFEPLLGRTFSELGVEARSMHKCQGTSQLLPLPGASIVRTYRLQDTVLDRPSATPKLLFDGIDTTLGGLAAFTGTVPPEALVAALRTISDAVASASRANAVGGPGAAAAPLARGLAAVRELRAMLKSLELDDDAGFEIDFRLEQKEQQFQKALVVAAGIRLDALADDGVVSPGQIVHVSAYAAADLEEDILVRRVSLAPKGANMLSCGGAIKRGQGWTCRAELSVPPDVPLSTPYWSPRNDAARYDFEPAVPFGVSFRPTPFLATFDLSIAGADVRVERPIEFRYDEVVAGEKRMTLKIAPPLSVRVAPDIVVMPAVPRRTPTSSGRGGKTGREIEVTVSNNLKAPSPATVSLKVPRGWQSRPPSAPVKLARENETATVRFSVAPPDRTRPGDYIIEAIATTPDGTTSALGYQVIEYPHIHRRHLVQAARTRLKIIEASIAPGLNVGYVMGVGDQVPQAIEQLGAGVHMIGPRELAAGNLSRYDVIVTGVRAYERRPDLRTNNHRLLEYARNGGTVLVQYNKFEFNESQYGPYPAKVGPDRVTDEQAAVEVLVPDHPAFTTPNRIGPDAWEGWVQERGLYFLGDRDPRYVDLVRLSDPFEYNRGAKTGALVEARVGQGRWIYVGLGLWRQLPAGTDGAYRIMANLLSLGRSK